MAHQPSLRIQADLRGDLRASVLASLKFDDGAGESETALAQMTGGSRSQVRNALENLLLTGRVFRKKTSHPTIRTIHLAK
jgi:predicted transcriptional regulator